MPEFILFNLTFLILILQSQRGWSNYLLFAQIQHSVKGRHRENDQGRNDVSQPTFGAFPAKILQRCHSLVSSHHERDERTYVPSRHGRVSGIAPKMF